MQTRYGLTLSQFTKAQCERLLAQKQDVPAIELQCAMVYLVRVLRWDKKVADDIITRIDALQLMRSGFATTVLEEVSTPIVHAGKGWILNLRAMMKEYDVSAQIEHLWKPSLQREHNVALLEAFSR
eukprot:scaffold5449_cov52-Cyclotella_meneghiniana.AAC.4